MKKQLHLKAHITIMFKGVSSNVYTYKNNIAIIH